MVKKRPQLNSEDLGRLRWGLGAILALLSVVTVFFMDVDAWLLMPAVAVAAVAALKWPTWPARLPGLVHRLAFPAVLLTFVTDLVLTRDYLPSLIRLDLMLILYRLITYRQRRDDLQLVLLGLFLIVVAGVITVSLSFAVQLLAFTSCALVMMLAVTLEHADGVSPKPIPAGVVPAWTRGTWGAHLRKLRAATDWRVATLAAIGFLGMVVLSGLLFLAIPRFELQNSLFIDRLINRTTRTGFSEDIRFGDVTDITQDNSLAFSVDITDPTAVPAVPYWRMVVLDDYTGEGFRMSSELRNDLNGRRPPRSEFNGRGKFYRDAPTWTIYMEPGISRFLPLLGNFYTMQFTEPQTFELSDTLRIVALQRDPPKTFAYRVWSMETGDGLLDASYALRRREGTASNTRFLELPEDEVTRQRLTGLVSKIELPAGHDAASFSSAVIGWLAQQHGYALASTVPAGDGDALIRWLDSDTPGHCELFAGSFVMLARAAGYPARLVTGFRGGTWNDFSGSYMVRNADAHAWCEIFDDATGSWVRFDPTPGNQANAEAANEMANSGQVFARDNSWRARLESLRVFWYRRIVNFDLETQEQMLSSTKRFMETARDLMVGWADSRAEALRDWLKRPWGFERWGRIGAIIVMAGALVWLWKRHGLRWWYRVRRTRPRKRAKFDPVRREASRWLVRAAKKRDFVWPAEIQSALLSLRYGDPASWPDPVNVFRSARRALRQA